MVLKAKENSYSRPLIQHWGDFIDWEKRRSGENGFLKNKLIQNNCKVIFESCLGDGCDSIYLIREGFDVTSNDLGFIKKAQENARMENVRLNITSYDWRNLSKYFRGESFDAVLCLGNSLTHLFKLKDREKTLKQFYNILKKGAILLIDERNYQYFLEEKKKILAGNFRYSHKYVYCGDKVASFPVSISCKKVVMCYKHKETGKKGFLEMYPFKKGELLDLLKQVGFAKIEQFSDYKKGVKKTADFYQYVCKK